MEFDIKKYKHVKGITGDCTGCEFDNRNGRCDVMNNMDFDCVPEKIYKRREKNVGSNRNIRKRNSK